MNIDSDRPAEATGQWYRLKVSGDSGAGRMSDVANIYIIVKNGTTIHTLKELIKT